MSSRLAIPNNREGRFSVSAAVLISTALLFAEHYLPSNVMYGSSVDFQVSVDKGSLLRQLCYLLIGCFGLVWLRRARHLRIAWEEPLMRVLVPLIMWCALSILWAQDPFVSARRFAAFTLVLIGAAGAAAEWSIEAIPAFISVSAAAHLTVGLVGEIALSHFTPLDPDYRFAGTLYWNQQGFCCLFLAMSSLAALDINPRFKIVFRFLFLYGVIFLVLTKSRSSLISLVVSLAIYLFFTKSAKAKRRALFWFGALGLVLVVSGLLGPIANFLSRGGEGAENLTGRQPLWAECWQWIAAHPIIGYGYEDFWTPKHIDYFSQEFHWSISAAHSAYLEVLLTLGAIGLLLHVSVLILGFLRGRMLGNEFRNPLFALASCFCATYLIVGSLEAVLVIKPSPYSFYFLLLLCSLCFDATSKLRRRAPLKQSIGAVDLF